MGTTQQKMYNSSGGRQNTRKKFRLDLSARMRPDFVNLDIWISVPSCQTRRQIKHNLSRQDDLDPLVLRGLAYCQL